MKTFALRLGLHPRPETGSGSPAAPARAQPYRVAIYGDSFGQRASDVNGVVNSVNSSQVNPVNKWWATESTTRVGGVEWGIGAWTQALSKGRYIVPYQLNRAIGGLNTGQLVLYQTSQAYLSDFESFLQAELATGRPVDAVLLHAGTNDSGTNFSDNLTYANLKTICQKITALGIKVVLHTILPRGNDSFPALRIDGSDGSVTGSVGSGGNGCGDRRSYVTTINARLLATFAGEFAAGMVKVVDAVAAFQSAQSGARAFDIEPALAYDGIHLSPVGCQLFAQTILGGLDALLAPAVASPLVADAGSDTINGLMAGSGGTVANGFTGAAPTGWTVGGLLNWTAANPFGTRTASIVPAAVGNAVQLDLAFNTTGTTGTDKTSCALKRVVTIPADVAPGDSFEAIARVEIDNAQRCLGADIELVLAEPDGVTRTIRSLATVDTGTALREWATGTAYKDGNALILRTPPRLCKAGTYGTISLNLAFAFATGATAAGGTFRVSQVTLRKRSWT